MPKTMTKQQIAPWVNDDAYLGAVERYLPEGASQTFVAGEPVKWSSGALIAAATVSTSSLIAAFALTAGSNNAAAAAVLLECLLAVPDLVEVEANFLGASAVDNVLAQADFGGTGFDLIRDANLLGTGSPGWYIADSTSTPAVMLIDGRSQQVPPNNVEDRALAGDTNARVRGRLRDDVCYLRQTA